MIEPLWEKIKIFIRNIITEITGHKFGCCEKIFKNCDKCLGIKSKPWHYQ